jgi:hypothetical protein
VIGVKLDSLDYSGILMVVVELVFYATNLGPMEGTVPVMLPTGLANVNKT